jgi:hypothetical protein
VRARGQCLAPDVFAAFEASQPYLSFTRGPSIADPLNAIRRFLPLVFDFDFSTRAVDALEPF